MVDPLLLTPLVTISEPDAVPTYVCPFVAWTNTLNVPAAVVDILKAGPTDAAPLMVSDAPAAAPFLSVDSEMVCVAVSVCAASVRASVAVVVGKV
jgi:hypothetical protein